MNRLRLSHEPIAQLRERLAGVTANQTAHAFHSPGEIDRGRPRREQRSADPLEARLEVAGGNLVSAERHAHRGGHADRRRPADHHVTDRARHFAVVAIDAIDLAIGEQPLIDHHDAVAVPLNCFDH